MSVLTKVFVVLVTVLSVLLVALLVPFVANTENYKERAREEMTARMRAEAAARIREAENNALSEGESQRNQDLNSQVRELISQNNLLAQDLSEARAAVEAEKARIGNFEADLGRATAALEQMTQIDKAREGELKTLREQNVDRATKLIQSADRINELTSERDGLARQVRRQKEEYAALREDYNKAQTILGRMSPEQLRVATAAPYTPAVTIDGSVVKVEEFLGEMFVQINIGSNAGVAENMKFVVHRGNTFLGNLVITLVDQQAAVGRLDLAQGPVQAGDSVHTGPGF